MPHQHITPDRMALEIAHKKLFVTIPLDEMLKHKTFRLILESIARKHMKRRGRRDVKKLQANDHD